jgi:hypothetical protein
MRRTPDGTRVAISRITVPVSASLRAKRSKASILAGSMTYSTTQVIMAAG